LAFPNFDQVFGRSVTEGMSNLRNVFSTTGEAELELPSA